MALNLPLCNFFDAGNLFERGRLSHADLVYKASSIFFLKKFFFGTG